MEKVDLNADIASEEGAICGGIAILMLDGSPDTSLEDFKDLGKSVGNGRPGILATVICVQDELLIERFCF